MAAKALVPVEAFPGTYRFLAPGRGCTYAASASITGIRPVSM
jgi:hypothetical protein